MSEHVYKHIELTGSSKTSLEDAIQNAVNKAAQTVRNMRWFVVKCTVVIQVFLSQYLPPIFARRRYAYSSSISDNNHVL